MFDTPPEIRQKQREIFLSMTKDERFRIGMDTIRFGFQLAESAIRQNHPEMTEKELKLAVFRQFYQKTFAAEELEGILDSMNRYPNPME